jgi:hypothetical protein
MGNGVTIIIITIATNSSIRHFGFAECTKLKVMRL